MRKYLVENIKENIINLLGIILTSLLSVTTAMLLTYTTNAVFRADSRAFIQWGGINLVTWAFLLVVNHYQTTYQERLIQKMNNQLRRDLSSYIERASYSEYHQLTDGQYLSRYTNDIQAIESNGFRNFYAIIASSLNIVLSSLALFYYHYILILVVVGLSILMVLFPNIFSSSLQKLTMEMSNENERYTSSIKDTLSGFDVFFYANKQYRIPFIIQKKSNEYAEKKTEFMRKNSFITNIIGFLNIFSQMAIDLTTGFLAILGLVEIGAISTTGNLASTIFNSLAKLSNQLIQLKSTTVIFKKFVFENNIEKHNELQDIKFSNSIEFRNVSYQYGEKNIINNLNLVLKNGKKYALIGESGSGKSTLLKMLAGQITDYEGDIFIDGIDIKAIKKKSILSNLQYIDQNVYLFNDTIKNNLTLGEKVSVEKIKDGLLRAKVDFIDGVNELVFENGRNFSGGQKQRIALARGFIENKKIILMDEGTSSLDEKTAASIENSLLEDEELTLIMVTHKLIGITKEKFDLIINMNDLQKEC